MHSRRGFGKNEERKQKMKVVEKVLPYLSLLCSKEY